MKILRQRNNLTVVLNDGTTLTSSGCTDEMYNELIAVKDDKNADKKVRAIVAPELNKKMVQAEVAQEMMEGFKKSKYLTVFGQSIYIKSISELTVPQDLATRLYEAELNNDTAKIESYLNFWTLASLNPDSRVRTNLHWFLNKFGMTISRSGLFVAYRNVVIKQEGKKTDSKKTEFISASYAKIKFKWKKSVKAFFVAYNAETEEYSLHKYGDEPAEGVLEVGNLLELYNSLGDDSEASQEDNTIYTDQRTKTMDIRIGKMVSLERDKCDSVQENTCSSGLHVAGRKWLTGNNFGNVSVVCLVSPTDVVAVPPSDNYGKMRVCAYFPVSIIEKSKEGEIFDINVEDGFEDQYFSQLDYSGEINNTDDSNYKIGIPDVPEINKVLTKKNLDKIKSNLKKYL